MCDKKHFIFSVFACKYYQLKKMNIRKLAVRYFAYLVLVAIYLGYFLFYSSFSQPCHISMCAMWASSDVRCRFLEHFFLGLFCFGSGAAGLAPPGRSALASVACEQALLFGRARRARENARARGPSRLRRSLARSRETRFARPNRRVCSQAMAPVPELHVSSFKHATWLNFADFCSSGDFVSDIDVLLVLWKTIRLILFIDDSLRVER